ncbi:MAG: hypothetical protein S4CHLAM102_00910 [Chlamydiia bacterium]|nr:hypothetical protein [Chlamydiia bacterium]
MSDGFTYNPKRKRNCFNPNSPDPFKLSRSKIELFYDCPCCFYLDRRCGMARPPGFPFNINSAVDSLLKSEFDQYRASQTPHPYMTQNQIDAVPFQHEQIEVWRSNFEGIEYLHPATNFLVTGAVDDVWVYPDGTLIIVDYKATSKKGEVSLDAEWQRGYKRQMEIYQWLFRMNGFKVSNTGYFVYCNGISTAERFDEVVRFKVSILPYTGSTDWLDQALLDIYSTLSQPTKPDPHPNCPHCAYRLATYSLEAPKPTLI